MSPDSHINDKYKLLILLLLLLLIQIVAARITLSHILNQESLSFEEINQINILI